MTGLDPSLVVLVMEEGNALTELRSALITSGAQVVTCRRVAAGVSAVDFHRPNAVVVDVEMEGGKGWEVAEAARRHGLPLVVLDSTGGAARRAAFAAGADEVVAKPGDAGEITVRVLGLVQRARPDARHGQILRHRDLVLDVSTREVRVAGKPIRLTPQQFAILKALLEANGATLARASLLARIARLDGEPPSERSIDLHVSRLKRRLGEARGKPHYVEAVYGVGYRLASSEAPDSHEVGERVAAVLDALPDAVFVVDKSLKIRYANIPFERLTGVPRSTLVGQKCGDVLDCRACDGRNLDGPRCLGKAVLAGRGTLRDEPAVVKARDELVPVSFSYGEVRLEGEDPFLTVTVKPRS